MWRYLFNIIYNGALSCIYQQLLRIRFPILRQTQVIVTPKYARDCNPEPSAYLSASMWPRKGFHMFYQKLDEYPSHHNTWDCHATNLRRIHKLCSSLQYRC